MSENSYTRDISVSCTPKSAYRALTHDFDTWWTPVSHPVSDLADTVTFKFEPTYWTMRVTKLIPYKNVELTCIDAHHIHEGLPETILKEWEGTKLKWFIKKEGNKTKISFVHEGLIPGLGCYEICEMGWDHFFVKRLLEHLENGEGHPRAIEDINQ